MQSSNRPNYLIITVIVTWLFFVIAGFIYFQVGQLKAFDSTKMLIKNSWFHNFKQQLIWKNKEVASLILVTEQNCGCFKQAKSHISSLTTLAKTKGLDVVQLQLTQELKAVVPATPAAIIIDKNGDFVYVGPLSEGLACAQGSGFVEAVINNLVAGYNSKLLITDTKGCYCVNKV
ncbi:DUF6436 domain-containing protein [Pseudoalteromonas sp.]|uniref:DUF6436 domain-containing protein n=1 Tax=Pseudoalteromonas sp. TaxID=53249 RepID=UPI002354B2F3|nr:DUF6436 domain-containing protein [Pseudoalteromonas sp.]